MEKTTAIRGAPEPAAGTTLAFDNGNPVLEAADCTAAGLPSQWRPIGLAPRTLASRSRLPSFRMFRRHGGLGWPVRLPAARVSPYRMFLFNRSGKAYR